MLWLHDPLTERTVRYAAARSERPNDFTEDASARRCPFCLGSEADNPAEVDRISANDGVWLTRVVPNRYPVVSGDDGAHEVVIESPRHVQRFTDLTEEESTAAVTAWSRRIGHWIGSGKFDYALFLKNEGSQAGASLEHVHSQVLAFPEAPQGVAAMWRRLVETGPPEPRVIHVEQGFTIESPIAPRGEGEAWIRPKDQSLSFAELADDAACSARFANLLQRVIKAIAPSAFNFVLQVPPASLEASLACDWWLEIVPRESMFAGFELATGRWINSTSPEKAARRLAERLSTLG